MRRRSRMRMPLLTEAHSCIIGAGLRASFTHPIGVSSMAGLAGGIGIGTIDRRCHDQDRIAVNIDVARTRSTPGEAHRIYSRYLAPLRGERDRRSGLRAVSPARVEDDLKVAVVSTPDDHLAPSPYCAVLFACDGRVGGGCGCP